MWLFIILILGSAVALLFFFRRRKGQEPPADVYVCDECGERECVCHKEEKT